MKTPFDPALHQPRGRLSKLIPLATAVALLLWACSFSAPDTRITPGMPVGPAIAAPIQGGRASISRPPSIVALSGIMIDARSGLTLYEKYADERLPVASTQKLLTAMEAIAAGDLGREVAVTLRDQLQPPTKLNLVAGERYRRADLLAAMLVCSANDAASALASSSRGSYGDFVARLNRRARKLGARNSHFLNPHGLDALGQHSTARDSAIIAFHAYRDPLIRHWAAQEKIPFTHADGYTEILENTNLLLWHRPAYFNGLKSGFTLLSGKCLVASAKYDHREIIIVLLGSTQDEVFNDAKRLFRWQQERDAR